MERVHGIPVENVKYVTRGRGSEKGKSANLRRWVIVNITHVDTQGWVLNGPKLKHLSFDWPLIVFFLFIYNFISF